MSFRSRKGKLKALGDKEKDDTDIFGLPASIPGSASASRPGSHAGDLSDEDITWSCGGSSYGACSVQDAPDDSSIDEDINPADDKRIDKDKPRIEPAKKRLVSAINAEHLHILLQQLELFLQDRDELAASGKVVFDIQLQAKDSKSFKLTRYDSGSFRKAFKVNSYVTIYSDTFGSHEEDSSDDDDDNEDDDDDDDITNEDGSSSIEGQSARVVDVESGSGGVAVEDGGGDVTTTAKGDEAEPADAASAAGEAERQELEQTDGTATTAAAAAAAVADATTIAATAAASAAAAADAAAAAANVDVSSSMGNAEEDGCADDEDTDTACAGGMDGDDGGAANTNAPSRKPKKPVVNGGRAAAPVSVEVLKAKKGVANRLKKLGLHLEFDGCVVHVTDSELVVQTRQAEAIRERLGPAPSTRFALSESAQDIALRRQMAAAEALGRLCSERPPSPAAVSSSNKAKDDDDEDDTSGDDPKGAPPAVAVMRRDEEVRLRQLLLCQPDDAEDCAFAYRASEAGVEWMGEDALRELDLVLSSIRLNEDQLGVLRKAARRSMTLLQGPPGTGKTYTLAAMGAAMCRVFHDPQAPSCALLDGDQQPAFDLPCSKNNMVDWTEDEVARWIQTFQDKELRTAALLGLKGFTGRTVQECKLKWLHNVMTRAVGYDDDDDDDGGDDAGPPDAAAWELARRRAEAFLALRDATLAALRDREAGSGAWATGFWRTSQRDMRILLCADTNTAANRLLESLVKLLPPDSTYGIVRLGVTKEKDSEGAALAAKYHIDNRLEQHPLVKVRDRLQKALNDRRVSLQLGKELQNAVQDYADFKILEAQKSERPLTRKKWTNLAELLTATVGPSVLRAVKELITALNMRKLENTALESAKSKIRELTMQLKDLALYDIVVAAQVVVGTNTSIGEVRSICEAHRMSFPIVLMDEAGQASEPSCMIPLTLGAEWVMFGGDMAQLPPTILSEEARKVLGFHTSSGGSQYGRLMELGVREFALTLQYRMHPRIREFPSRTFYEDRLREDPGAPPDTSLPQFRRCAFRWPTEDPAAAAKLIYGVDPAGGSGSRRSSGGGGGDPVGGGSSRRSSGGGDPAGDSFSRRSSGGGGPSSRRGSGSGGPPAPPPPCQQQYPIAFLDVAHGEERRRDATYYNVEEADLALKLLLALAADPSVKSVVIITPYKGQVQYINERLEKARSLIFGLRRRGGDGDVADPMHYAVHTVDGFQGHEADVIIISTVLTGESLRFLADERRLNVAITRARRGLIILGRAATLARSRWTRPSNNNNNNTQGLPSVNYWARLLDHIKAYGGFVPGQEVARLSTTLTALPKELACVPLETKKTSTVFDFVEQALERQKAKQQQQERQKRQQQESEPQSGGKQQGQQEHKSPAVPVTPPKPPRPPKAPAPITPPK